MICPNCNFQNKPDARFCAECGFSFAPAANNPVIQPLPIDAGPSSASSPSFDVSNIKIPPRFFSFLKPYLNYIDKGSIFRRPFFCLYVAFSILCLLAPLYSLYWIIDKEALSSTNSLLVILAWLLIAFTFWLGFQMWWDRKNKIQSVTMQGDEFVAIPVFSYFIQHFGEWLSLSVALLGFGGGLLSLLFSEKGNNYSYGYGYSYYNYFSFREIAAGSIWRSPLIGFIILVLTRVVAEILRALTSIANNTKKL